MDKTTKILIGVVAALAVLALIVFGLVFFGLFGSSPEEPDGGTIATVEPLLTPTATVPAAAESFITILEPRTGAIVDVSQPVTVAGRGGGLPEGNVVVQALDPDGNVLAEEATIVDSPDAGTGGEGPWAVALDIDVEPGTAGRIRAFSPSPEDNSIVAEAVVEVSLGQTEAVPVFIQIDEPLPGMRSGDFPVMSESMTFAFASLKKSPIDSIRPLLCAFWSPVRWLAVEAAECAPASVPWF